MFREQENTTTYSCFWKNQLPPNKKTRLQSKLQEEDTRRALTYCLSITAFAATCRVDNMASRSCFFNRIIASSSTFLYGCPPCPVLPFIGTGMGCGREVGPPGPVPGSPWSLEIPASPPAPAADMIAAAMLSVFGGKEAGKGWGPGGPGGPEGGKNCGWLLCCCCWWCSGMGENDGAGSGGGL